MAKGNGLHRGFPESRAVAKTDEFKAWARSLDAERRAKLAAAIDRVVAGGPNLGRPHVDTIHKTNLARLKEVRVDRGVRVLFAFDSNQKAVMLVGGDKTGKWKHWYPNKIKLAERLYADHERRSGKEPRCLNQQAMRRTPREMGR